MDHLGLCVAQVLDGEGDGALLAAEVVVDTQTAQDEQGTRHAAQAKARGQVVLKEVFDDFDTLLGFILVEQGVVVCGDDELTHCFILQI